MISGWFDVEDTNNTTVYISGLPLDITDDDFKELMNKCGMLMYDPIKKNMKLRLYKDEQGGNKGDGLCTYIKVRTVDLYQGEARGWSMYLYQGLFLVNLD